MKLKIRDHADWGWGSLPSCMWKAVPYDVRKQVNVALMLNISKHLIDPYLNQEIYEANKDFRANFRLRYMSRSIQ